MGLHPHNVLGLQLSVTVEGTWVTERGSGQSCGCVHHVWGKEGRAEGLSDLRLGGLGSLWGCLQTDH